MMINMCLKKVVPLVITACITTGIMTIPAYAETNETADETIDVKFEQEKKLLRDLGILKIDIEDAEQKVNRGQFADIAMRTYFKEIPTTDKAYTFSDVIPNYEYKNAIEAGYGLGFFRGTEDNVFGVDKNISQSAAITVMLRILNYEKYIISIGDWEKTYLDTARNIELTDGIKISDDDISFGDVVRLIYNAIQIPPLELESESNGIDTYRKKDDSDLLYERLKIDRAKGIITANRDVSFDGGKGLEKWLVRLDDTEYNVGETDAYDYLGYNVKIWFDEDTNTILHIEDYKTELTAIDYTADCSYSGGMLSYYRQNGGRKSINISPTAIIVYNGSIVRNGEFNDDLFDIDGGDIKVIEKSYDGHMVVIITSYTDIVFDRCVEENDINVLINKFDTDRNIYIRDFDMYHILDRNGKAININDIQSGAVISAAQNLDKTAGRLIVNTENNEFLQAYVTSASSDSVKIKTYNEKIHTYDNKEYNYSKYFKNKNAEESIVKANSEYAAYIDAFNMIAYMSYNDDESDFYAYIVRTIYPDDETEPISLQVFGQNGKSGEYKIAKNIKIDNISFKNTNTSGIINALGIKDEYKSKLVFISLSYNSEIRSIDTCLSETDDREKDYSLYMTEREANDTMYKLDPRAPAWTGSYTDRQRYSSENSSFNSGVLCDTSTVIMAVPRDDIKELSKYQIIKSSEFINDREYKIKAYSRKDDKLTPDIVVYEYWSRYDDNIENAENVGVNQYARVPFQRTYDLSTAIVTQCSTACNPETGDVSEKITMILMASGAEITYYLDENDNLVNGINEGQLVRYYTLAGKLCYIESIYSIKDKEFNIDRRVMRWQNNKPLVYSYYLMDDDTYLVDNATSEAGTVVDNPTYSAVKGFLMQIENSQLAFVTKGEYESKGDKIPHNEWKIYNSSSVKVYKYNERDNTVEKKNLNSIITANESSLTNTEVLIVTKNKRAIGMIIY